MKHSMPGLGLAAAIAITMSAAAAQEPETVERYDAASVAWLKTVYLNCDRLMSSQRVEVGVAQRCAIVGEQLKQRGFGGDFAQLIEWWKSERRTAAAAAPPAALRNDKRVSF